MSMSMSLAKVDYFERAKRLAEIPLLQKQYEEQLYPLCFWHVIDISDQQQGIALWSGDHGGKLCAVGYCLFHLEC